jgi:hypothetical protein
MTPQKRNQAKGLMTSRDDFHPDLTTASSDNVSASSRTRSRAETPRLVPGGSPACATPMVKRLGHGRTGSTGARADRGFESRTGSTYWENTVDVAHRSHDSPGRLTSILASGDSRLATAHPAHWKDN